MMPTYICKRCHHEFAGWGVYYVSKSGNRLICPDCSGNLVEKTEEKAEEKPEGIISRLLNGRAA